MQTKKLATETPKISHHVAWFVGIYLASILAMGLFYAFSHWLVQVLKG